MGCNVACPCLPGKHQEDWGLDDPTGKSDQEFEAVIAKIEQKVKELAKKIRAIMEQTEIKQEQD
jgi:arsenate reductase